MDPGNWSTDIAGGSAFNYDLLFIVLLSSILAIILQAFSVRLGAAMGKDLAQACREQYRPWVVKGLWVLAETAIAACDMAEVIGSAIALNLLFDLPLVAGVFITSADVLFVLMLQGRHFRFLEALIGSFIFLIGCCFIFELAKAKPDPIPLLRGLLPKRIIFSDPARLYCSIGIIGATVMARPAHCTPRSRARRPGWAGVPRLQPSLPAWPRLTPRSRRLAAAQPVPSQRHRANPQHRADLSRKVGGGPLCNHRQHRRALPRLFCQRRHPHHRRGGVLPTRRAAPRCAYVGLRTWASLVCSLLRRPPLFDSSRHVRRGGDTAGVRGACAHAWLRRLVHALCSGSAGGRAAVHADGDDGWAGAPIAVPCRRRQGESLREWGETMRRLRR